MASLGGWVCDEFSTWAICFSSLTHVVPLTAVTTGPREIATVCLIIFLTQHTRSPLSIFSPSPPSPSTERTSGLRFPVPRTTNNGTLQIIVLEIRRPSTKMYRRQLFAPKARLGVILAGSRIPSTSPSSTIPSSWWVRETLLKFTCRSGYTGRL